MTSTTDDTYYWHLMRNGLKGMSLSEKTDTIRSWITNSDIESSLRRDFSRKEYTNFLYYILLQSIDDLIGNSQKFVDYQNYAQEVKRLFAPQSHVNVPNVVASGNNKLDNPKYYLALSTIDAKLGLPHSIYDELYDYKNDYLREFRQAKQTGYFDDKTLKQLLDKNYPNFKKYQELHSIDEQINNCFRFKIRQNYEQEAVRQVQYQILKEELLLDENYAKFLYYIEIAIRLSTGKTLPKGRPNNFIIKDILNSILTNFHSYDKKMLPSKKY